MPDKVQSYLRVETALAAVVLVAAAAGVVLFRDRATVMAETVGLEERVSSTEQDLVALAEETVKQTADVVAKEAELERKTEEVRKNAEEAAAVRTFSTLAEAEGLSAQLLEYAKTPDLVFTGFGATLVKVVVARWSFPRSAIRLLPKDHRLPLLVY